METVRFIKKLAEILNNEGLTSISVQEGALNIKLERHENGKPCPREKKVRNKPEVNNDMVIAKPETESRTFEIRSPIAGRFWAGLEDQHYVYPGAVVKKGDPLCLIECDDQLNEVTSDMDGTVCEILVIDGMDLQFDQVMFKISE